MNNNFVQGGGIMEYVIAVLVILLILLIKVMYDSKQTREQILYLIKKRWGAVPDRKLTPEQMEAIRAYYNETKRDGMDVDDITWNDVGMDELFALINNTCSSIGEEYLYALLRKLECKKDVLEERERLISFYQNNEKDRIRMQCALSYMGKLRNISFFKQYGKVKEVTRKTGIHVLYCLAMIASIVSAVVCAIMGISSPVPIMAILVVLPLNIIQYYRRKAEIEQYYYLLSYVLKLLYSVDVILAEHEKGELTDDFLPYKKELIQVKHQFRAFRKKAKVVTGGKTMSGDLMDMLMDYVRMMFHIDLIMFDSMIIDLEKKEQDVLNAYEIIGKIDSAIAIASFRTYLENQEQSYCVPQLYEQVKPRLEAKDMYHPLILNPVKNSIMEKSSVLITGSNASGKSTFIKTVALNAIFAQTVHTCTCSEYVASFFKVYSSMALTDNLQENESYYIVEIKSLKRILDRANDKIPTLCFVDEVLRGTNTLERIAASSQILKYLSELNVLCFAATHDIELTYILERYFKNYHFQEEVKEKQVVFNYKLQDGRASSRNAIKLLDMIGYPEEVIDKANQEVTHFSDTGNWNVIAE